MVSKAFDTGQLVTVELVDAEGRHAVFEARLETVASNELTVVLSGGTTAAVPPSAGAGVFVSGASGDGLHYFEAKVLEASGEPLRLRLAVLNDVQSCQRRQFVRLAMHLPITCVLLDETEQPHETCSAFTFDVGGKGAGLLADRPLPVGRRVRFKLDLEKWGRLSGLGVVRRSVLTLGEQGPQYRVAVEFMDLSNTDQARIFSYLLARRDLTAEPQSEAC